MDHQLCCFWDTLESMAEYVPAVTEVSQWKEITLMKKNYTYTLHYNTQRNIAKMRPQNRNY